MRYSTIVFAALLASCGQAKTSSKNVTVEETSLSALAPADPSAAVDTVLEHIDKGDGLIVDVMQAGTGRAVQMGDTVTLDYTISYVPSATPKADTKADKGAKDAKESKSAPKHAAKKPGSKHSEAKAEEPAAGAATDDHPKDGSEKGDTKDGATKDDAAKGDAAKKDSSKTDADKSGVKDNADKKSDGAKSESEKKDTEKKDTDTKNGATKDAEKSDAEKSDSGKTGAAKTDTAKTDGDKPEGDAKSGDKPSAEHDASTPPPVPPDGDHHEPEKTGKEPPKTDEKSGEVKPAEALQPVIVASTKTMLSPFTVKLSNNAKPKLMPGLVRGLEGLKVGTHARITVPALLAYGKDGNTSSGIPAETPVQIDIVVVEARE